jgi:hypothetical protein
MSFEGGQANPKCFFGVARPSPMIFGSGPTITSFFLYIYIYGPTGASAHDHFQGVRPHMAGTDVERTW